MKKNRLFAPFLMLLAGAVASIVMRYFRYSTGEMLPILLCVLIIFYFGGCFIQKKITAFMKQIKEEEAKEGEVVEKELSGEEGEETGYDAGENANNR